MRVVGRNEACPCGSGKKFKKCCGGRRTPSRPRLRQSISIKTAEEVEGMRAAGKLAARVLNEACAMAAPGVTTDEIDQLVLERTLEAGAYPAPLNYPNSHTDPRNPVIGPGGFPKSVCTSVNEVVCHGIPDGTPLADGDIVNIDVTCNLGGFHGDTSRTVYIGEVSETARRVTEGSRDALAAGIETVRPGAFFQDIGAVIEKLAHERELSVVRDFTGHGIGREFHEPPAVLHYRDTSTRVLMREGMIFTIEPMLNVGSHHAEIDDQDGWTARTVDGELSAQFEHTILVTPDGHEILTLAD